MDHKHWQLKFDDENIAWLGLSRDKQSTNTLNVEVLGELSHILNLLREKDKCAGLAIYSLKENGFIAGADVECFKMLTTAAAVREFLTFGQKVIQELADFPLPTIAIIHGFCMGGGLELALACDYRIVLTDKKASIGLPEVKLGLIPGWEGTVRLLRLTGAWKGLPLICQGRSLRAADAKRLHIVDDALPSRQRDEAVHHYLTHRPPIRQARFIDRILDLSPFRSLFSAIMMRQVSKQVNLQHYPNIAAVIEHYRLSGIMSDEGFSTEIDFLCKLIENSQTPSQLIRVFFLQERLKSFGKTVDFKPTSVHVVGAGTMGSDIAAWCALNGFRVTLQDTSPKALGPAMGRALALFKKRLKDPLLVTAAMDRLLPDVEGYGIRTADVIIEAIYENIEAKQHLFKRIEEDAKPDAVLATNTSSIPLETIAEVMQSPNRLVGIHFFNPVEKMPLVEVVRGKATSSRVFDQALAFVTQIDRLGLPVTSTPGFLVNRVLMPYLMECMNLMQEGIPPSVIDKAAVDFGMPMGPVELADRVGLDICLAVAENLTRVYGGEIPEQLRTMVSQGKLGYKTSQGFYRYQSGQKVDETIVAATVNDNEIADRLIMRMLNEAARCLAEGVVEDADLLDAGMIFGTGFAPFRGGPMNFARSLGEENISMIFTRLEKQVGERFLRQLTPAMLMTEAENKG